MEELNTKGFYNKVIESGQPSIILFGINKCGFCLQAKNLINSKWEKEHPAFKFYYIDVQKSPGPANLIKVIPPLVPQMVMMVGKDVYYRCSSMPNEEQFLEMISQIKKIPKNIPSLLKRILLLYQTLKRIIKSRKLFVSKIIRKERLNKCNNCIYLIKEKCGAGCGCYIKYKTLFVTESCPKEFWK